MGDGSDLVQRPGAWVEPLDDLPERRRRSVWRLWSEVVATLSATLALVVALFWGIGATCPDGDTRAWVWLMVGVPGCLTAVAVDACIAFQRGHSHRARVARRIRDRCRRLETFQWFEVWAVCPSAPPARPWDLRHHFFLQLVVHPDPAVPRFLTRGTDLVVTGGCTADDLRVVTAHLDVVLHLALLHGFDDPGVSAAIRPVPQGALLVPSGRRQWEVHDPAAAHALIAADLASGWPTSALVARYRDLLSAGAAAR